MSQLPLSPNPQDASTNIERLLQLLSQEFAALQQHHSTIVKEKECLIHMARSGMDLDDVCKDSGVDWPVLTFDADTQKTEVQVKKESVGSVLSLMHKGGDKHRDNSTVSIDVRELGTCPSQDGNFRWPNSTPTAATSGKKGKTQFGTPQSHNGPNTTISSLAETPCSRAESNATGVSGASWASKVINLDNLRTFSKKFGMSSDAEVNASGLRRHVLRIYQDPRFETAFAVVIMLNATSMCLAFQSEGDALGHRLEYPFTGNSGHVHIPQDPFEVAEWVFGLAFTFELLFKSLALQLSLFKDLWNWVDIVTVAFFIFEKLVGNIFPVGSQWIRICRLARLTRLVRLVRTIEGFDHLYLMTTAIKGSARILGWAMGLLLSIQMTIALIVGQVLQVTYFEVGTANMEKQHQIYAYFGTFSRSLLSMFELTLANWPPICRLLSEEVSEWFMLVCVVHKLTIGFAVVGVINGVFMQETFKVASTDDIIMVRQKEKAMQRHRQNMFELFNAIDSSGDGKVNLKEFRTLAEFPSVKAWLASMEIRTDDLDTMFDLMDGDGSGGITFEEMLHGMEKLKGHARSVDLFALLKAKKLQETYKAIPAHAALLERAEMREQ